MTTITYTFKDNDYMEPCLYGLTAAIQDNIYSFIHRQTTAKCVFRYIVKLINEETGDVCVETYVHKVIPITISTEETVSEQDIKDLVCELVADYTGNLIALWFVKKFGHNYCYTKRGVMDGYTVEISSRG